MKTTLMERREPGIESLSQKGRMWLRFLVSLPVPAAVRRNERSSLGGARRLFSVLNRALIPLPVNQGRLSRVFRSFFLRFRRGLSL